MPPDPERAGYIPVRGGSVWYRMNGGRCFAAGKIPLLVIHGGPGASHHYLLTLTDLERDRPVILYDGLDCGNSERPGDPRNWTIERFVSEIDSVRHALNLDRLLLFGSSWGGTVAAEYAMTRPRGLTGLVLASPLLSTVRWIADTMVYRQHLPADVRKTLDEHEAAGTTDSMAYQDAVMAFYQRHLCRLDPWPDELNRSFAVMNVELYRTMWGRTEFSVTGTLKDYDGCGRLHRINVPTLYTAGEYDEATPEALGHFASLTPTARVHVIPDASHTAFLEQRGLYITTLRSFFAGAGVMPASKGKAVCQVDIAIPAKTGVIPTVIKNDRWYEPLFGAPPPSNSHGNPARALRFGTPRGADTTGP